MDSGNPVALQRYYYGQIADAIRDKEGSFDLIAPADFPSRIRAISAAVAEGLPPGGSLGQALTKASSEDGDVRWSTIVDSFNGRTGLVYPQEGDYTADDVGAVPTYRQVNGRELTSDIVLTAEDLGAASSNDITNIENNLNGITVQLQNLQEEHREDIGSLKAEIADTVKIELERYMTSMNFIRYGATALISNISPLDTGTLYVQYE